MSELSAQFGGAARELSKVIGPVSAVVLGPIDIQGYTNFSVYVKNVSGADLTVVSLESAPEQTGPWVTVDAAVLAANLVAAASTFKAFTGKSLKFIRLSANCAADEALVASFWFCASRAGL